MSKATEKDIKRWYDEGRKLGATHMVVVSDVSIFEEQPRYIMKGENRYEKMAALKLKRLKVGPLYDLAVNLEPQMAKNMPKKKKIDTDEYF